MPISKIVLNNQSKENVDLDGQYVRVPHGTTAQRPSNPVAGFMRFNTTLGTLEQWNTNTNNWAAIDSPPIISSLSYSGSNTATDPAGGETITLNGSNFKTGFTITVGGTNALTTTFVNSTTVRFTVPAKTAGDYDVVFTNTNGLSATLTAGISVNGVPAFTTAAGNVGSITEDEAMSTITIVAAEPDSGTVAFSVTSGALPTGVSMSSAGAITGTPNVNVSSDTTYNFTVTATDDENQTTDRAFNLIVLRPVYTRNIQYSYQQYPNENNWAYAGSYNVQSSWTWSCWVRMPGANVYNDSTVIYLMSIGNGSTNGFGVFMSPPDDVANNSNTGSVSLYNGISGGRSSASVSAPFRDSTKWHHLHLKNNNGSFTLYINGVADSNITNWSGGAHAGSQFLEMGTWHNGGGYDGTVRYSEFIFRNGVALEPSEFGEDVGGDWRPKDLSNYSWDITSYTNGVDVYLNFENWTGTTITNAAGLGSMTASVSLATLDGQRTPDTPTNTYPCLNNFYQNNSTQRGFGTLYSGASVTGWGQVFADVPLPITGKWYFEGWCLNAPNPDMHRYTYSGTADYLMIGVVPHAVKHGSDANTYPSQAATQGTGMDEYTLYKNAASNVSVGDNNNNFTVTGNTIPDISERHSWLAIAWDADTGKLWFGTHANTGSTQWIDSTLTGYTGNPATGANPTFTLPAHTTLYPTGSTYYTSSNYFIGKINFGDASTTEGSDVAWRSDANGWFRDVPPTGFKAPTAQAVTARDDIATYQYDGNNPEKPRNHFNVKNYTGNGTSQSITGIGFQPDMVWIKNRDRANTNHIIVDSVRGAYNALLPDGQFLESTYSNSTVSSLDSDGFSVAGNNAVNYSGDNHTVFAWKAGGAPTATNTNAAGNAPVAGSAKIDGANRTTNINGDITILKQTASNKSGFSITTYVGTGTSGDRIDHGLARAPTFWIIKKYLSTSSAQTSWIVGHKMMSGYVVLDTNAMQTTPGTGAWNGEATPSTDTFIHLGNGTGVNAANETYIMYAWTDIQGVTATGGYIAGANAPMAIGSSCNPLAMLMFGITGSTAVSKALVDKVNKPVGGETTFNGTVLYADLPDAAGASPQVEFRGNGFQIMNANQTNGYNEDDTTYGYVQWGDQFGQFTNGQG